jgi:hypothetical protein
MSREPRALHPVDVDAAADAARMLVALHERVERQFEAYEAAEGSAAVAKALATHVAVEDELLYPTLQAHTGRHDAEIERQRQPDQDRLEAAPVGARRPPVAAGRGGYVRCCRARSDVS